MPTECDLISSLSFSTQWKFEQSGGGWTVQNVGAGKFLNISEDAHDGTKVVATENPREWVISPDEQDQSCYR